ncbi:MAG TPA: efflux RND transporter periplasmic adaptor subunit, partial [Burkholderiales bacterium]|nr:efflux RND transporter periplasmic adaptor subunit [Burkholderiales bacterium]
MKLALKIMVLVLFFAAAIGGGYWWGARHAPSAGTIDTRSQKSDAAATPSPKKILYYRNPMGLADTSPVPKKDAMGMDYIPVYEGDEQAAGEHAAIKISTDKVQKLGVRTETAALRELTRTVRAVGTLAVD